MSPPSGIGKSSPSATWVNSTLLSFGGTVTATRSSLVVITLVSTVSRTTAKRIGTSTVPGAALRARE